MPIAKYYGGKGESVMQKMTDEYGADKGKQVFYATANKRKQNPGGSGRTPKVSRKNKTVDRAAPAIGKVRTPSTGAMNVGMY